MTNQEILTKAIDKAVAGGWKPFEYGAPTRVERWQGDHMVNIAIDFPLHKDSVDWVRELEGIIFNHDFAKALWGERRFPVGSHYDGNSIETPITVDYKSTYLYHLQQMVIADDPIEYLRQNMPT